MTKPRVVVIGAGAAGLSTAWACAELAARSVVVIDQGRMAGGSSGLSAGIVNRQVVDDTDRRLRQYSVEVFEQLSAAGELTLSVCGYLRLTRTSEQLDRARQVVAGQPPDRPSSEVVTPSQIAAMVPGIRTDDLTGGLYGAADGHLDGPDLCQAYLRRGGARGVEYRPDCRLLGARRDAGSVVLETSQGPITCDVVVNAAGPWLEPVGAMLGVQTPVDNQRHQIGMVHVPSLAAPRDWSVPTVQSYFPDMSQDAVYVRPERPGAFVAGLHSYAHQGESEDPDAYRHSVDEPYLELLAEALHERFPGWDDAGLTAGWSGLYPLSPDGQFVVGPHRDDEQVVTVGGLGGVGLTVSPAVGRLAAEWAVLGEPRRFDFAEQLLPDRPALVETT